MVLMLPLYAEVDYNSEIQPIFDSNCINCHSGSDAEEDLSLTSYDNLMNGGESGDVVIPYDHANSLLWQYITFGYMPPGNNDLTGEQVDIIAQWINEGALPEPNESNSIIFEDNLRVTNTETNQKFPEAAIDGNGRLHLTWVSIDGSNKNIMYTSSDDAGDTFADPIQINYVDDNIVAFGQSGPLIKIRGNEIFIVYTDDRNGYTSIFTNISYDLGLTWEQEILITDTEYLNAYHDFEIHTDGSIHFIYYNYGEFNNLENVKYRYAENDISQMSPSIPLGISTEEMAPCHCCQPDMEVDKYGNVYVVYRNNIQNIRDAYLAVKRYTDNTFTEYYQVSDTQDFINHCPSSGPSVKINDDKIAIAYTAYSHQNAYISISTLDELNFSDYISLNPTSTSFQNYPDIFLDDNVHSVWVDFDNWDIYYGMRDSETNTMVNIQKINDVTDAINSTESDPVIYKDEEYLYSFWSDQRHSHYEIYFSRATANSLLLGDLNSDGVINILDVVGLVNIILGISPENPAGDLNQDGVYNVLDIVQLVNIILDT